MEPPLDFAASDALVAASDEAARLLRAMGHGPRLRILCLLLEAPCSSGDIARALGMREAAASQQLALLRGERLIEARREGQRVIYAIASPVVAHVVGVLRDAFCR
jgi:DNA-binding transcriptional ArsR family regulator